MSTTTKTAIPKLRFPEFEQAGAWEEKTLGEVADVRDGTHDSPKYYTTGKPLLTSKNLLSNGTLDLINVSLISEEDYDKINMRSKVAIGDILFGMIGTIGNPVMIKFDGFAIKNVALIKEGNIILNRFLVQLFNSEYILNKINILNTGNSQKFIALGVLRKLNVLIPSIPEQEKIADTLSSLDEIIAVNNAKLEALKIHKQGLMQQLFPAAGEKVPRLRFPEFANAGDWEEKTLGEVAKYESSSLAQNKLELKNEGFPVYGASGFIGFIDTYAQQNEYISIVKDGSGVGRISLNPEKSSVLGTLGYMFPKDYDSFNTIWVYCLLQTINFSDYVKGLAIPHVYFSDYSKHIVFIPTLLEQEKIAACLSSLDESITAQSQKIEALQEYKKGLMQGLFPTV